MAATKIPDSDSYTQGLIQYLKDTSQCSRDNIFLRELGSAANFKHQLHALLDGWIRAEARSMLVQWIEANNDGHREPIKIPGFEKLPKRQTNAKIETSDLGAFFGDSESAKIIRRSQTVLEQKRWGMYFETWGCLVCQRRNVPHASNGMCHNCRMRTYERLKHLPE
jgi:hypothetical protein